MVVFDVRICHILSSGAIALKFLLICILSALLLIGLILVATYCCFCFVFYVGKRRIIDSNEISLPKGKDYEQFYGVMTRWILDARKLPHEDVSIASHDGLRLTGKFYEFAPGAPIELMFHGYRGSAERDMSGGIQRAFLLGRSVLVVEQRCSNTSEGNVITFGIKEHLDCLDWVDFVIGRFGPDVKIILTGISMGASTVLMAAGKPLPANVIGVLADCGFTTAKDIMYHVMRQLHLPARLCYPFVKLGSGIFGRFDLEADSALTAVRNCRVPVIFFHGEADDFVPYRMSRENYDACPTKKKLVIVPGAGHGLSYPTAPDLYLEELLNFFGPDASHPSIFENDFRN